MPVVAGDGKRLRRHDAAKAALGGELVVVVQPVGVVHRLRPALDVEVSDRVLQARTLDGFAEVAIDIGTVESFVVHWRHFASSPGSEPAMVVERIENCRDRRRLAMRRGAPSVVRRAPVRDAGLPVSQNQE